MSARDELYEAGQTILVEIKRRKERYLQLQEHIQAMEYIKNQADQVSRGLIGSLCPPKLIAESQAKMGNALERAKAASSLIENCSEFYRIAGEKIACGIEELDGENDFTKELRKEISALEQMDQS